MSVLPKNLNFLKAPEAIHTPNIFFGLTEDQMQLLLSNASLQSFPAGKILIEQGDTPKYLYCINSGVLKTMRNDIEGREATIRLLRKGETCMDAVIFMDAPSPIAIQVIENATLLMLPADFVRKYVLENARFAKNILRIVSKNYKIAMQQLDCIITKPPLQRLGFFLLKEYLEQNNKKLDLKLPFKKSLIANHLGMTPETFSRTLNQMKKHGITIDRDHIFLKNVHALCQFCDTDTAFICTEEDKKNCPNCPHKN